MSAKYCETPAQQYPDAYNIYGFGEVILVIIKLKSFSANM